MMSFKLVLVACAALLALSTASTLKGIPDSEERTYLYVNEEAGEFWFALGSIPDGTDISTKSAHQELAVVSEGIGTCHADAEFQIATGSVTATMTFKSTTGLPSGKYFDGCKKNRHTNQDIGHNLDFESDKQTRVSLPDACSITSPIKFTTVKMVRPFDCHIWLVVKGTELTHRLKPYQALVPPTELGLYAGSNDRHPHPQFGRSADGKRIIDIMEARYSFHDYYKGANRPIPTIELATDACVEFEIDFEVNDVCKLQFEILPDHEFNVRVNYLEEIWWLQNRWNAEFHVDGDANGTQIVFTKNEVLLYVVHPRLQIFHLGTCDLGQKDFSNATFVMQAWCDKARPYTGCVVPALKFVDEVFVKRPPKPRPLHEFNWEKQEPLPQYQQKTWWTQRNVEILGFTLVAILGVKIGIVLAYKILGCIDDHYRHLPPGHWY